MSEDRGSLWSNHPFLVTLFAACAIAGAVAGVVWLPEEWALWRRLLGGLVAGSGIAMLVTGPKLMIGN